MHRMGSMKIVFAKLPRQTKHHTRCYFLLINEHTSLQSGNRYKKKAKRMD